MSANGKTDQTELNISKKIESFTYLVGNNSSKIVKLIWKLIFPC